jgi:hypothetical protein
LKAYNIERTEAGRPLRFFGELRGEASSYAPGKRRWTEARVYYMDPAHTGRRDRRHYPVKRARWVAELVGVSTQPGEHTKSSAFVCFNLSDLVEALEMPNGNLGRIGRAALEAAGFYPHPDYNDEERNREVEREGQLNDLAEARRHR